MIALWLATGLAWAGAVPTHPPVVGETTLVLLTDADGEALTGVSASAIVHPGLPDAREKGLGVTDARGRVHLTPETPGAVLLRVDGQTVGAVHVAWPSPPLSVLVPLLLLMLAGGVALRVGSGHGALLPPPRS